MTGFRINWNFIKTLFFVATSIDVKVGIVLNTDTAIELPDLSPPDYWGGGGAHEELHV